MMPLRTRAPERTKTEHKTTITSLAKPEKACAGVSTPNTMSATRSDMVITSIGIRSRKKATIAAASRASTTKI